MIESLPRVVPPPSLSDRPQLGNAESPIRKITRQLALERAGWSDERRAKIAELFDGMAATWHERGEADATTPPVRDALARGGPLIGPCVEVGAGTGKATSVLVAHFGAGAVLAVDVAMEMLRQFREPRAVPLRADGACLPVRDGSVGTLVLVNAFLFPGEVERVLAPDGAIVWVNTLGEDTPIHLPVADVVSSLHGSWRAVTSEAGWGLWGVVRRGS